MRKIVNLAWNDILVEFSDRWTLVFFLVLPLVFTAILGVSIGGLAPQETGDTRFVLVVTDLDKSAESGLLLETLAASTVIRPEAQAEADARAAVAADDGPAALLVIPQGMGASLADGQLVTLELLRKPDSNEALAIEQAVTSAVRRVDGILGAALTSVAEAEARRPFASQPERGEYFSAGLEMASTVVAEIPLSVTVVRPEGSSEQIATGFEQSSPGQLVTWTLITLLGASEVFVAERLGGTLRRLLTTPTTRGSILTGKIGGRLSMGLVQMALLIGVGALVFKVDWGNSPVALVLVVVAFGLAAVSMGVMVAAFVRTRSQASGITILLSMTMAALGGAWWPLEITPPLYQTVVKVLPSTWAMMGFTDIIVRGQGVAGVMQEVVVLLGFAVVFLVVGVSRLKFE